MTNKMTFKFDRGMCFKIKPHLVLTYCGCICVETDGIQWGTMDMCNIHKEKNYEGRIGELFIPNITVMQPLNTLTDLNYRMRWTIKRIKKFWSDRW
jgi:hypothetical protein